MNCKHFSLETDISYYVTYQTCSDMFHYTSLLTSNILQHTFTNNNIVLKYDALVN